MEPEEMHFYIASAVTRDFVDHIIKYDQLRDILAWLDNQLGVWDPNE
jgi:hypothetical protein